MITTTLNKIRQHRPCKDGWERLLKNLGKTKADDEALPLLAVLDIVGLNDALWCARACPEHDKEWRLFAVWCARQVQHLMTDERSIAAIDTAERYADGKATDKELHEAWYAAFIATISTNRKVAKAAVSVALASAGKAAGGAAFFTAMDASRADQEVEFRRIIQCG